MSHTKTPWLFETYDVSGITKSYRVRMPSGYTISTSALDPDKEANTRLIAAAPDLLSALDRLLNSPDLNLDNLEDETIEAINQAKFSIKKTEAVQS